MAIGEAACVSVHGANRLGSNSLIDLVVFGRAAGLRAAERRRLARSSPNCRRFRRLPSRLDGFHYARAARRRRQLRLAMQKVMQANCAVYRTGETLAEGSEAHPPRFGGRDDIGVTDRSLIWTSISSRRWNSTI